MNQKLIIDELGGNGDGIVHSDHGPIYVPFSVTGDVVEVTVTGNKGRLVAVEQPSPHRVIAQCAHFTKCGGCALQHVSEQYYKSWKSDLIKKALINHGLNDIEVAPLKMSPLHSRRRTSFQAIGRGNGKIVLGYAQKSSHNLVDVTMCPILETRIANFINPLRLFLSKLLKKQQKMIIQITNGKNGLDVIFKAKGEISLDMRMDLASFAAENDLARISWFDTGLKKPYYELLAELRKPYVFFQGKKAFFPEGAFLQATVEGQQTLTEVMLSALQGVDTVVDLFSGCGTFSIAAAKTANVHAVENNEDMLNALKNSAKLMTDIRKVTTELRDLFLRPLLPHELNEYDVAIIDPPRAGARNQMTEIMNSDLKKLIMISCNPVSFAREARNLVKAGFKMGTVIPVDQFLFTSHLEIICIFER